MDYTFNEGHITVSLLGQFSGHVRRALILKSEAEVNRGERWTLLLELNGGQVVIIELKALMPHQFVLPVNETHLREAEELSAKGTKFDDFPPAVQLACIFDNANRSNETTHFWDQTTKREVQRYLQTTPRNYVEKGEPLGQASLDDASAILEDLPLKVALDEAKTVRRYFEKADTQVQLFGSAYWNQESKGDESFQSLVFSPLQPSGTPMPL